MQLERIITEFETPFERNLLEDYRWVISIGCDFGN